MSKYLAGLAELVCDGAVVDLAAVTGRCEAVTGRVLEALRAGSVRRAGMRGNEQVKFALLRPIRQKRCAPPGCFDHLAEWRMQLPDMLDGMETVLKKEKRPSRIAHISWDRMEVEGLAVGKVRPPYGREHAWNLGRTEARRSPGIQPADTEELAARGARPNGESSYGI